MRDIQAKDIMGDEFVDIAENLAIERAKKLFQLQIC